MVLKKDLVIWDKDGKVIRVYSCGSIEELKWSWKSCLSQIRND